MRKIYITFILIVTLLKVGISNAEDLRTIYISDDFASYVFFPENLGKAELGVPDDIDAKIEGNTIKITALQEFNYPTNLTVYALSGNLYAFYIKFQKKPQTLYNSVSCKEVLSKKNIAIDDKVEKTEEEKLAIQRKENKELLEKKRKLEKNQRILSNCERILSNFDTGTPIAGDQKGGVTFLLYPLLAKNNFLYFVMSFQNDSKIDYKIEDIFTTIVSRQKKMKRSAVAKNTLRPYLIYENPEETSRLVKSNKGTKIMVLAFDKFTIDDDKYLQWEAYEVGGERNLKTKIKAKVFYKASNLK